MKKPIINLEIVAIERKVFEGTVDAISAETPEGQITILPGHIPLITLLATGEVEITSNGTTHLFAISRGFLEVRPNKVIILAETAERAEEIDEQRALEARKRAEEILNSKKSDDTSFADASAALQRSIARLKVARRRARKKGIRTGIQK
jgi:F-type H+-transporting ATPase subunit epsilon